MAVENSGTGANKKTGKRKAAGPYVSLKKKTRLSAGSSPVVNPNINLRKGKAKKTIANRKNKGE